MSGRTDSFFLHNFLLIKDWWSCISSDGVQTDTIPARDSIRQITTCTGLPKDKQIGLIAQEVEKVFPELVSTDSEGYKSIAYGKLTAVLIEAIKELQQQRCQ